MLLTPDLQSHVLSRNSTSWQKTGNETEDLARFYEMGWVVAAPADSTWTDAEDESI